MSETLSLTERDLIQFIGSETWYRHGLVRRILFTDGAKYVADHGGAYWLLDEIALSQIDNPDLAEVEFQAWRLVVNPDRSATLTCEDGDKNPVMTKVIPFTDFPLTKISLFFANNTIYLPSEH